MLSLGCVEAGLCTCSCKLFAPRARSNINDLIDAEAFAMELSNVCLHSTSVPLPYVVYPKAFLTVLHTFPQQACCMAWLNQIAFQVS